MKLSLYTIATLFILGIGIFLLGITLPTFIRNIQYNNEMDFFKEGFGLFLLFGIGYVITGIIMLLRHQSAIKVTTFILVGSMIGWVFFFYTVILKELNGDEMLSYPLSLFVLIFLFILTLFINNDKVLASIDDYEREEAAREDILDKL